VAGSQGSSRRHRSAGSGRRSGGRHSNRAARQARGKAPRVFMLARQCLVGRRSWDVYAPARQARSRAARVSPPVRRRSISSLAGSRETVTCRHSAPLPGRAGSSLSSRLHDANRTGRGSPARPDWLGPRVGSKQSGSVYGPTARAWAGRRTTTTELEGRRCGNIFKSLPLIGMSATSGPLQTPKKHVPVGAIRLLGFPKITRKRPRQRGSRYSAVPIARSKLFASVLCSAESFFLLLLSTCLFRYPA